jgi:hypothetical protein
MNILQSKTKGMPFSTAQYYHSSELKKMSHSRRNTVVVPCCHVLFSFYLKIQFFFALLNGWNARTIDQSPFGKLLTLFMIPASGIRSLLGVAHLFSDLSNYRIS